MKHTLIIILTILNFGSLFGQSITPDVHATSGEYFTGTNAQLSWTMGESIIETVSSTSSIITQGFQQPNYDITGINENPEVNYGVSIFPNPVNNALQLNIEHPENTKFKIELMDLTGKQLTNRTIGNTNSYQIDFNEYASGTYFLKISTENGIFIKTFKIQKTN